MTNAISGSIGSATESNHCAANSLLDNFARYRRSLHLAALSLGLGMISEVGYLHENPEIETSLLSKGLHPINENELLQIMDIAIPQSKGQLQTQCFYNGEAVGSSATFDHHGHILTGLELEGLQNMRRLGFEPPTYLLDDPRTSVLAGAFAASANAANDEPRDTSGGDARSYLEYYWSREGKCP